MFNNLAGRFFFGIGLMLFAALGQCLTGSDAQAGRDRPKDRVLQVRTDDAAINAAKNEGRATAGTFLARLQNPQPDESNFEVKFDLTRQQGRKAHAELIWASDLKIIDGKLTGRLANKPETSGYAFGQRVQIAQEDIVDWAILKNGHYEGHFTTRALLPHMTAEEAAAIKQYLGWN